MAERPPSARGLPYPLYPGAAVRKHAITYIAQLAGRDATGASHISSTLLRICHLHPLPEFINLCQCVVCAFYPLCCIQIVPAGLQPHRPEPSCRETRIFECRVQVLMQHIFFSVCEKSGRPANIYTHTHVHPWARTFGFVGT